MKLAIIQNRISQ